MRPPLLSLGDRACDATPNLSRAVAVPFDSLRGTQVDLGEQTACLAPNRSLPPTTYAVFALPRQAGAYALTFESLYTDGIVSKPMVSLLDADGRTVRTLADSEYEHLGSGLRAGMRLGSREAFLVASADTAVIGNGLRLNYGQAKFVRLASNAPIVIYSPPPMIAVPPSMLAAMYALNGTFHVYALPVPMVK